MLPGGAPPAGCRPDGYPPLHMVDIHARHPATILPAMHVM